MSELVRSSCSVRSSSRAFSAASLGSCGDVFLPVDLADVSLGDGFVVGVWRLRRVEVGSDGAVGVAVVIFVVVVAVVAGILVLSISDSFF